MEEVSPAAYNEYPFKYWPYRLNYFQLNAKGHAVVAAELSSEIRQIIDKLPPEK